MSATEIMAIAMLAALVGRWANNQKAVPSAQGLIEIVFALLVISFLDHGRTEPIAKGFAYLFLAAVLLSDNSPLTGLAKLSARQGGTKSATTAAAMPTAPRTVPKAQ